jgi:GTP-binding protein HflX
MVRLKYMAPRLREAGQGKGDRQRGGIGGKGAGESALELDRRKIRDRMAELEEEIEQIDRERQTQRARRQDLNRVALVGYTNAGKSTLMRGLTGSEVYVADKLFATLDTTVRQLQPESRPRVLMSDTVGFIEKLPHDLVASFKSTLDEALEASLLAHVVDAADPAWPQQLAVTHAVLAEIGAGDLPRLIVFNKMDKVANPVAHAEHLRALHPDSICVSAMNPGDLARLRQAFIDFFDKAMVEQTVRLGWDAQSKRARIHEQCLVVSEEFDEEGALLKVRAPAGWRLD